MWQSEFCTCTFKDIDELTTEDIYNILTFQSHHFIPRLIQIMQK